MANNLYTTKTASLKATKADVGKLNTNKLDSSEIRLRGQNIEELLKVSPKELVFRCELPEDKPWSLWSDDGNLLYFNKSEEIVNGSYLFSFRPITTFSSDLSSLTNGTHMFYGCDKLTSFSIDFPSLTNGYEMFRSCDNLTTFTSDLSSLTNGSWMFCWCSKLTTFDSDLSSLTNGTSMFHKTCLDFASIKRIITCLQTTNILSTANGKISLGIDVRERLNPELMTLLGIDTNTNTKNYSKTIKTKNGGTWTVTINWQIKDEDVENDLSSLQNGISLLTDCYLETFSGNLSSLTDGSSMFHNCQHLKSFTSDLPNLTTASSMFNYCYNLTTFSSDSSGSPVNLSNLTTASSMFSDCWNLTSFNANLSSLINGGAMFHGCSKLTSFSADLSKLTRGVLMFSGCWNLTSFTSDLSSLTEGSQMFGGCKLDKESVKNIITCLKERNTCSANATITIGIDKSLINDAEILELLGITAGAQTTTLVGHGGGTWDIKLQWL